MAVRVRYADVTSFRTQLAAVPKGLRRELRPRIKGSADKVAARVRSNASWSSRIPAATKVQVSFAARGAGVRVYVDHRAAPHARPYEFGSQGSRNVNRHPVFGNRQNWVDQPTRPFFMPAIRDSRDDVVREVQAAITDVLGRIR